MSAADWYIVVVCLGTGASIPVWWARHGVPRDEGAAIWFHVAAELVTAAVLVAAGISILADHASKTGTLLSAFGLGMLGYSLIHSPGPAYDRRDHRLLATFAFSWLMALPAVILRFLR